MAARLVKVFHVRLNLGEVAETGPHPLAALNRAVGAARVLHDQRVLRDQKPRAQEPAHAPIPPRTEISGDSAVMVRRDEKIVVDDRNRDAHVQPILLDKPPAKWGKRQSEQDEPLSVRDIAVTLAAVIVVSFGFTALLPSILTRDGVESTVVATAPPVQPPPIEPVGTVQPAGNAGSAQPAAAPVSNAPNAVANTAPALRTGIVPPGKQAGGRATAVSGTDLKGAEKTAAVAAPRRPAPARPALTDDERAAIERGLRELEKTAEQAKP